VVFSICTSTGKARGDPAALTLAPVHLLGLLRDGDVEHQHGLNEHVEHESKLNPVTQVRFNDQWHEIQSRNVHLAEVLSKVVFGEKFHLETRGACECCIYDVHVILYQMLHNAHGAFHLDDEGANCAHLRALKHLGIGVIYLNVFY
jgi:hypothetical protein